MKTLSKIDFQNIKSVGIRVDFNVPLMKILKLLMIQDCSEQ